jgi:hypothetical protein
MGFDPYNRSPKTQESIENPIPKMGTHLGMWGGVIIPSLSHTPKSMKCDIRPSHLARTFASPYLGRRPQGYDKFDHMLNKHLIKFNKKNLLESTRLILKNQIDKLNENNYWISKKSNLPIQLPTFQITFL